MLLLSSITFLPGCSTLYQTRVETQYIHDTTAVHHRDSIFTRDSIYIKEWMKGDTVYIDRYRDRYIYKDRWRDSVSVRVDSVAVETIREVNVEQPLSWWQKARIGSFWWLLGGLILCLTWIFRKPIIAILKSWFPL
jgi:hypothetical protein